jgi:hypothetical protein
MTVRINWTQGEKASDGHIRIHELKQSQPGQCQFAAMTDSQDYPDELSAAKAIWEKGFSSYKRCTHCMDGSIVQKK